MTNVPTANTLLPFVARPGWTTILPSTQVTSARTPIGQWKWEKAKRRKAASRASTAARRFSCYLWMRLSHTPQAGLAARPAPSWQRSMSVPPHVDPGGTVASRPAMRDREGKAQGKARAI